MREVISGTGPWRIIYLNGRAVRVEIRTEGRTLVIGARPFVAKCARCGTNIKTTDPDNTDQDCCERCEDEIERELRG